MNAPSRSLNIFNWKLNSVIIGTATVTVLQVGLDKLFLFSTYYSIFIFSKNFTYYYFQAILFSLPLILNNYYSSSLMAESGQNNLQTLQFYTITKQ